MTHRFTHIAHLLLLTVVLVAVPPARAQSQTLYSVALRGVPLNEALAEFSNMTNAGVSFDPILIERKNVFCVIDNAVEEDVLSCILSRSGLDHIRLSSGTYVIVVSKEQEALHGSLAGIVRDRDTGRPLPNAHILLASARMEMGVVTNANGQFTLPPLLPGSYLVNASYLGYHDHLDTLVVQAGQHDFRRIDLREEPILFTPLVIDGLQRRRPIDAIDKSVLYRVDSLGAGDYFQRDAVLQQIASIPGVRINDLTADAHLQGSDAGEHQFRLDGVPIFLPQSAIGLIGPFSPFAIESITVHQSGFGVEQGSHLAGVMTADHRLEATRKVDVQVDPMSLNARLGGALGLQGNRTLTGMVASRSSLWRFYQQPAFQNTLNEWSKPDPFLIFGPSRQYASIAPEFFQDILAVSTIPNTDMAFQDIHAAGKYEWNAFSALRASVYLGKNKFGGTLLPSLLAGRGNLLSSVDNEALVSDVFPAPLSLIDEYRWDNVAGQVSYHTLLGNHTLLDIQARASSYGLDQDYRVIDSLEQYIDQFDFPEGEAPGVDNSFAFNIPTLKIRDTNDIQEYGLIARLEHARARHLFSAGLENVFTASRFNLLVPSLSPLVPQAADSTSLSTVDLERIEKDARNVRFAGYLQDRINLGDHTIAEAGIRVTYLPSRKTVYAEPRLAIRFDYTLPSGGAIAWQTAAGLYRQYLLQFDISTLNAGALFPTKRVWLPVNEEGRPPLAYHMANTLLYNPTEAWTIRASTYLKLYQRAWTINYLFRQSPSTRIDLARTFNALATDFQSESRGSTAGASLLTAWEGRRLHASVLYEHSTSRRKSNDLFANETTSLPWEEPHRTTVSLQWLPAPAFMASAQFRGVWGRKWGFRKAYYDFFGHSEQTRYQPPFDFGDPDSHKLPALYQLDLSAVYSASIKSVNLQFRFDVLNALNYDNVVDWRLVWEDDALVKEERLLYPRIPSIALRVGW